MVVPLARARRGRAGGAPGLGPGAPGRRRCSWAATALLGVVVTDHIRRSSADQLRRDGGARPVRGGRGQRPGRPPRLARVARPLLDRRQRRRPGHRPAPQDRRASPTRPTWASPHPPSPGAARMPTRRRGPPAPSTSPGPWRTSVRHARPAASLAPVSESLVVRGAREHNLKNVGIELPRDKLIVFTGLSGSGKSSLAFDTIYAEGQRRYVESLSSYARQFLGQMDKPDVDFIEGLSPAISIDQKSASRNPRSTVGTITEVYDYLRLLYARIGVPHCPECGAQITRQTPQQIVDRILELPEGTRFQVLAPGGAGPQGHLRDAPGRPGRPGLRPGPDRRRGPRAHRQGRPGPLRAAHDRGGRRPPGRARGPRAAPHRLAGDGAAPGRRRGRGPAGAPRGRRRGRPPRGRGGLRRRHPDLLPAPGLPERPRLVRGAGPPQLLLQLALRRLRDLRRARHQVRGRPRR